MNSDSPLNHRHLYRLPWSVTDNVISWLEPTKQCNIYCEGCYSTNNPGSHKSLDAVRADLDTFDRCRQTDAVSIAGGEPLIHPEIVEIVREVARRGHKPIVNTNGVALTRELLMRLKEAGLRGLTFHVDSGQRRQGWAGKNELELNALRQHYAELVAGVGGLSCAFNATVYENTLHQVADIVEWGRDHADIVHVMVFIAFRAAIQDGRFEYYVNQRKIEVKPLAYGKAREQRIDISSRDVLAQLKRSCPELAPCAYLNGTEEPEALKWLMLLPITDRKRYLGCAGPRFSEISQVFTHLFHNRYLGYVPPKVHRRARWLLALSLFDRGLREVLRSDIRHLFRDPFRLFRPLHIQSIMIIQPVDALADGRQSMCDSCPDMTVHEGKLAWSCRLEERLKLGGLMEFVPRRDN